MEQQYYLLSLKWSDGKGNFTWWGPNACGYTEDLQEAGIYTETEIKSRPLYYSNKGVMPIEIEKVQSLPKKITILNSYEKELGIREFLKNARSY